MKKMTRQELVSLFPPYEPNHEKAGKDGLLARSAKTRKKARHVMGKHFKPRTISGMTPAMWRHTHQGRQR